MSKSRGEGVGLFQKDLRLQMENKRKGVSLGPLEGHSKGASADLWHQALVWTFFFFCCRVKTTKSFEDRGTGSAILEGSSCCPLLHKPTSAPTRASGETMLLQEQWPLPAQRMLAGSYFGPALVGLGLITAVRRGLCHACTDCVSSLSNHTLD